MNLLSKKQKKSQKAKIEPLQSLGIQKESFASVPEMIPCKAILHRSCKTCPLSVFIEAYSNNNLELLGDADPQELQEAWNEILFEWATLLKSEQSEYIFDLSKKISSLHAIIIFIEKACDYLSVQWDEEMAECLRKEGYNPNDIKMTLSLAKRLVFDLDELTAEYSRIVNTTEGKGKSEDEFFEDIAMLSKFVGYRIDTKSTTVKEYASIFNLFLKQSKVQDNG